MEAMGANGIKRNFSVLGGEPLAKPNCSLVKNAILSVKNSYPEATIYMWTGYILEELDSTQREIVEMVDILVDGRFELGLKDLTLELRGSSNQRVLTKEDIINGKENKKTNPRGITTRTTISGSARIKK